MKIALVCDAFYPSINGVTSVLDFYGRRMAQNHEVYIISAHPRPGENVDKYLHDAPYKVIWCKIGHFNFQDAYRNCLPKKDKEFQRTIGEIDFDIIHTHSLFGLANYMRDWGRARGIPVVCTLHMKVVDDFLRYDFTRGFFARKIARAKFKGFYKYDMLYSLNNGMVDHVRKFGYKGPTTVIHNGADLVPPKNFDEIRNRQRAEFGVGPDVPLLLFVGRIIKLKGIFVIAKALAELRKRGFAFKMVYVGNGPEERKLHKMVAKLGLGDVVTFTGKVTDRERLKAIYASADLFLFPSFYDVECVVKIEAAALRTPTLGWRGAITVSDIVDGENGFLADKGVRNFADKIVEATTDRAKLSQIGEAAQRTIYRSWDDCADKMVELYKEVIDAKRK